MTSIEVSFLAAGLLASASTAFLVVVIGFIYLVKVIHSRVKYGKKIKKPLRFKVIQGEKKNVY